MRGKLLLIVAVLFVTATMAQAQPNVPILEVDTLAYLGKTEIGEAKGAFFLPDGNIIAVWKGRPLIIDSKSGEIIRILDVISGDPTMVENPKVSKDGKYLCLNSIPGLALYDITSGKVVKYIPDVIDYALSKDGLKLYTTIKNESNDPGIIIEYDMNTLEKIGKFCDHGFYSGGPIDISPDGQTLAIDVSDQLLVEPNKKTDHVILIDLKDKSKFAPLESMVPSVMSLEFSPDGKNLAYLYHGSSYFICIYNLVSKERKFIYYDDLKKYINAEYGIGIPRFLSETTLVFASSMLYDNNEISVVVPWMIEQKTLKKVYSFYARNFDIKNDKLLMCSSEGALAIIDTHFVSIKDNAKKNESYIKYTNNQLELISDKAFIGESIIYDTTGKMVAKLDSQPFFKGKNIIRINQLLQRGIYVLTIKNGTEQNSYKFIVE